MFLFCTKEELEHASKLMAFQNKRAGHVVLRDIKAPECAEWTPEKAIEKAIEMELEVTQVSTSNIFLQCIDNIVGIVHKNGKWKLVKNERSS